VIYIDDYNSKAITNTPPNNKREDKVELAKAKLEINSKQLAVFWHITGVAIANNFSQVKALLLKYGFNVVNEEDAAVAISEMIGTPKWTSFVVEIGEIIENTVDEKIIESLKNNKEESSWVEALISAVGSVAGSSLGLGAASKQQKVAKENAKSQMFSGITSVLVAKENTRLEAEKTKQQQKKSIALIIVSVVIVLGIIIAIIVYRRRKQALKN
jgi:hypothetical protein